MKHFTKEQIEEIRIQLATRAVRDSDFDTVSAISNDVYVPILKDGNNKKTTIGDIKENIYSEISSDGIDGKILSTNDYTDDEKEKLESIESGAQVNVIDGVRVNGTDIAPIEKKVNVTVPTALSDLSEDTTHKLVTNSEKATWNGKYSKPSSGIPKTDLSSDVQTSLNKADTALQEHQSLANYYTKSETYTKEEVATQITNAIKGSFVVVASLPTASADTLGKIYLVPSADAQAQNIKDEYITVKNDGAYSWEKIGSTAVSLNGVVKFDESQSLTDAQKTQARANIGAGTYSKPSGGIPTTDLVESIQESLEKLDNLSVEYGDSVPLDTQRPLCFVPLSILASSGFLDVEAVNDLPIFGGETAGMYLILQNYCAASGSIRYSSVHTMKHNQEDITYLVYALSTNGTWSFGYYEVPSGVIDEASNAEIDALFV